MNSILVNVRRLAAPAVFLMLLVLINGAQCFTSTPRYRTVAFQVTHYFRSPTRSDAAGIRRYLSMNAFDVVGGVKEVEKQIDPNGKEIIPGCVVRLVKPMKAYHLQCAGKILKDKVFIPAAEDEPPATKCLELPSGLRGIVIFPYDMSNYDASQPIVVKFSPGLNCDEEGYDTPVQFSMHFESSEVERVD